MSRKKSPQFVIDEKSFWFQFTAFDVLEAEFIPRKCFPSALITYRCLCAVGSESESEPGPEQGQVGKPFETTVDRISFMVNQPPALTRERLLDFAKVGLIDPPTMPEDGRGKLTVRLRKLETAVMP